MQRTFLRSGSTWKTIAFLAAFSLTVMTLWAAEETQPVRPMLGLAKTTPGVSVFAPALSSGQLNSPLVNDHNLQAMGEGGVLSGPGSTVVVTENPATAIETTVPDLEDWRTRYSEQVKTVRELEESLDRSGGRLPPAQSAIAATGSPHFVDPGVVGSNGMATARHQGLQDELAAERRQLENLRSEGRRIGIQPGEVR